MGAFASSDVANALGSRNQHRCFAPAKINLTLHITGQRDDGYHLLDSLVVFCDIGDVVSVQSAHQTQPGDPIAHRQFGLSVTGEFGGSLNNDEENLVAKAARFLLQDPRFEPSENHNLLIDLQKNLPVSSGMGGGSADAVATLLALQKFGHLSPDFDWFQLAEKLGADVPMCLYSMPLIARGIGEELNIVERFPDLHLVLANAGTAISTPSIFRELIHKTNAPMAGAPPVETLMAQRLPGHACKRETSRPMRSGEASSVGLTSILPG